LTSCINQNLVYLDRSSTDPTNSTPHDCCLTYGSTIGKELKELTSSDSFLVTALLDAK